MPSGQSCPDTGDAGTTIPVLSIVKLEAGGTGCEVTDGMFVKKSSTYRVDLQATATGYCNVNIPDGKGGCYTSSTQLRNLGTSTMREQWPSGSTYTLKVVSPVESVQYYNTVGPVNTQQVGASWPPPFVGSFVIKSTTNVTNTACNFFPTVYPAVNINVNVRTAFHRGTACDGSLDGGGQFGEGTGTGYYHEHADDPPGVQDTWTGKEHMTPVLQSVGAAWNQNHSSQRMGILDLSLPGGGPMPPHGCHENGLDVDVRYVKASEEEGPLDLTAPNLPTYSKPKTVELLQLFANTGLVELIYVHPNSGITPGDVSSVVVDPSITHRNHFHVRLIDPDGANSNNC
jgi:hypothetical protein